MTIPVENRSVYNSKMILKALFYCALSAVFVLAVIPEPDKLPEVTRISDKINHIAAFAVLALLIDIAFPQRNLPWKVSVLLTYGLAIECAQYFVPSRECSLLDLVADGLGIAAYYLGKSLLARLGYRQAKQ
jgi:VanZ family protein